MNKKDELLTFLNAQLFNPIQHSYYTSNELKSDFQYMFNTINRFSVEGILIYFWTIMSSDEMQIIFSYCLSEDISLDFSSFLNHFKSYFTYEWLSS